MLCLTPCDAIIQMGDRPSSTTLIQKNQAQKGQSTMKLRNTLPAIIATFLLVLLFASWFDTINHNLTDCIYQWWNIFTLVQP